MPPAADIVRELAGATRALVPIAVAWHLVVLAAVAALAAGWRPSRGLALLLLATPLASVAAVSLAFGNVFNTLSFAALAVCLAVAAGHSSTTKRASCARGWVRWLGTGAVAFGWAYPHFLDGSPLRALYGAPLGVVPCPTLAVVAGFVLLGKGLRSRAVTLIVAGWAGFYAIFGVLRLGVMIDVFLGGAAIGLAALAIRITSRSHSP